MKTFFTLMFFPIALAFSTPSCSLSGNISISYKNIENIGITDDVNSVFYAVETYQKDDFIQEVKQMKLSKTLTLTICTASILLRNSNNIIIFFNF